MTIRHFVASDEWPDDDILALLDRALDLKSGSAPRSLAGRVLVGVFFDPSLRTRTSFEVAMAKHCGHMVVLEPGRGSWAIETRPGVTMDGDAAEHLIEAAGVLGRYGDAVAVRAFPKASSWSEAREDAVVRGFAAHAGVPVINLESARRHPCQGLADALTLRERFGPDLRGRKFVLSWAWHPKALPTAVPTSAALAAARLGMEVVVARPEGFDLDAEDMETIKSVATRAGGSVQVNEDLGASLCGADAVYAKSWGALEYFGDPVAEARLRSPHRDWRIDEAAMKTTRDSGGIFLHCLPVRRNVVVTDGVLDGPWSAVVDQAENRLWAQQALLETLFDGGKS